MTNNNDPGLNIADATAATVGIASFMQYLPSVAAFLSIIWFVIRILESETAQMLLRRVGRSWIKQQGDKPDAED